jgi:hypothetical protein
MMNRSTATLCLAASLLLAVQSGAQQPAAPSQSTAAAEMSVIHAMLASHDAIKRTVTNLPDGIRTVTEADDSQIANLIREHVASMNQRVNSSSDPELPDESPALKLILRNGDKVKTTVELTGKGAVEVQTSKDPEIVAALQSHALEVSDLVQRGMEAMMEAMMKNGGGMMQGMTHAQESASSAHSHDQHQADVNNRGDQVMGFDHARTTHHFRLMSDGGAIEVEANDPQDTTSRDQIRQHLSHIARLFAEGDFTSPMLIHAQTPPGVPVMKQLKSAINYRFENTERGGRIRITTSNREALAAVHDFLTFQIKDHATGDTGVVEKR